jgi:hypothetical protein
MNIQAYLQNPTKVTDQAINATVGVEGIAIAD